MEAEIRQLWETERLFEFKPQTSKNHDFVMDTRPPYPSGRPWHPGALTRYSQIDMIARAARMRGYNVLYPVGIDRNGLPVEIFAERIQETDWQDGDCSSLQPGGTDQGAQERRPRVR